MTDTPTFNLLDEPWIKCMDGTNQPVTLSIRDVFRVEVTLTKSLVTHQPRTTRCFVCCWPFFGGRML